jgi:hypothetical protein
MGNIERAYIYASHWINCVIAIQKRRISISIVFMN